MSDLRSEMAAEVAIKALRARVRWLRESGVHPFGFGQAGTWQVSPRIVDSWGSGTLRGAVSGLLGAAPPVWGMTVEYGARSDRAAPFAVVISDFRWLPSSERLAADAVEWQMTKDMPEPDSQAEPAGKVSEASTTSRQITVVGSSRTVPSIRVGDYEGLQFREDGVLVTIVARNAGSDLPEIGRLDDLEPLLRDMENVNREDISAWFAATRASRGPSRSA